MRGFLLLALVAWTNAFLLNSSPQPDGWSFVGTPGVVGNPVLKLQSTQDLKCHGSSNCGDPFLAFYNSVTQTCVDKLDAGGECGYFPNDVSSKVCKFEFVCHDWKKDNAPSAKTCLRPSGKEMCSQCACGKCATFYAASGEQYSQCDTSCDKVQKIKEAGTQHCARATVDAQVEVTVEVEDPEGRRGSGSSMAHGVGQATECVPCGPGAAAAAQKAAEFAAQKAAIENAVTTATVEARKAAINEGKNAKTRKELEAEAAAAEKASADAAAAHDAAEKEAAAAQKELDDAAAAEAKAEADRLAAEKAAADAAAAAQSKAEAAAEAARKEALAAGKSQAEADKAAEEARQKVLAEEQKKIDDAKAAAEKAAAEQEAAEAAKAAQEAKVKEAAQAAEDAAAASRAAAAEAAKADEEASAESGITEDGPKVTVSGAGAGGSASEKAKAQQAAAAGAAKQMASKKASPKANSPAAVPKTQGKKMTAEDVEAATP